MAIYYETVTNCYICEIATNMPRCLTQGTAMTVLDYIEIVCPVWFGCQIAGGEITEKNW